MAYATDEEVTDAVIRLVAESKLDVLFLHFDEVDRAGHRHGYSPDVQEYVEAIERIDGYVGNIVGALAARPSYSGEDWLVMLTTDHGGSATKGPEDRKYRHGDDIPEHRTVFLILSGQSAVKGPMRSVPHSVDVPPTVLAHLGVEVDSSWGWDGRAVGLTVIEEE
jgi:arylsulfatase A-like enzyme